MSYASRADMVTRFGETEVIALTDRSQYGQIDDVVLAGGLDEADAEINPYLQPKYVLPLPAVPRIIISLACDLARYRLCGAGVTVTEDIRNRYKDAIKFLERVSRGEISLGIDSGSHMAAPANTVQISPGAGRVFGRDSR